MYLYNGGTTEYQCSTIGRFIRHGIGTPEVPNCSTTPWVLLAGAVWSRTRLWIFRADYIEHHFEARAMLPPISDALCNRLFLFFSKTFSRFYIQNWMTVWMRYDFAMTWAKQRRGETPGQERHSGKTAKRKVRQNANLTLWQKRKKRKSWVA